MLLISNVLSEGKKIAQKLNSRFCFISEERYPDSEKKLIAQTNFLLADIIYFKFNAKDNFDEQLFNLLALLNKYSNKEYTNIVLPYLPYLRSYPLEKNEIDKLVFVLNQIFDRAKILYLICPHGNIEQLMKQTKLKNIFVIDIDNQIIKYLRTLGNDLILVSPDMGFSKTAKRISIKSGFEYITLQKKRLSPSVVNIQADKREKQKIVRNQNKTFVILDDIVSTGDTLVKAVGYLKSFGVKNIKFLAIHDTRKKIVKNLNVICSNTLTALRPQKGKVINISEAIISTLKN